MTHDMTAQPAVQAHYERVAIAAVRMALEEVERRCYEHGDTVAAASIARALRDGLDK